MSLGSTSVPPAIKCLTSEAESVRFGFIGSTKTPGPGHYEPLDYPKVSSTEGTIPREKRGGVFDVAKISPGPVYDPFKVMGTGPKTVMSRAPRFPAPKKTPGHHERLFQKIESVSVLGTLSLSPRAPPLLMSVSPGPAYNTRSSFHRGTKNQSFPKAERFPVFEDDNSPGPVYMPKKHWGPGPSMKFTTERRDKALLLPMPSPGPGAYPPSPLKSLSFSFGVKPKAWIDPSTASPGPAYYNIKPSAARAESPAFSFAAPDPEMLALQKQQRTAALRASAKARRKDTGETEDAESKDPMAGDTTGSRSPRKGKSKTVGQQTTGLLKEMAKVANGEKPTIRTNYPTPGLDSPGPAHYLNIYKLFEAKANPKSFSITGLRRDFSKIHRTPGPSDYCPESYDPKYEKPHSPTFSRAFRDTLPVTTFSPGPIYNNDKWTTKTPIRLGVATQTTNYTSKAEARAKAEREMKEKAQMKHQLASLENDDLLPCDEEYVGYIPPKRLASPKVTKLSSVM